MKLFLVLFLWPLLVQAEAGEYLKSRKKFYAKTVGDGTERGVQFSFRKKMVKKSLDETPIPDLEISNNSAQCTGSIKIDKIEPKAGRFQWVYYIGIIDTEVEADTGGCIALARWPENGDILKIVDYFYITNF